MSDFLSKNIKGILLCLAIAIPAYLLVKIVPGLALVGAPVLAIVFGMIVTRFIKDKTPFSKGIGFTSKKILQTAVVLLGFGLNLATVAKVGAESIPVIISTIATSLIVAFAVCKISKLERNSAVLIGVGSSICGGSAIAATALVIGADDEEIAQSISVVFLFNVIAALIFPSIGGMLGLSDAGFGLFAGTAINDTSSVTAAAATWDVMHSTGGAVLEYATIVKLTRTLAIIPITLALAVYEASRRKDRAAGSGFSLKRAFPMFILYFLLASVVTTAVTGMLSGEALAAAETVFGALKEVSRFLIVMAMSAIGLNTDIVKLIRTGAKPIMLGLSCWVMIAVVSLIVQNMIGIA